MVRFFQVVLVAFAATFCVSHVSALSLNSPSSTINETLSKNGVDPPVSAIIDYWGTIPTFIFQTTPIYNIDQPRVISCLFMFDKEASASLLNNPKNAQYYADTLAILASKYTAHANIVIKNAGTEMWSYVDRIPFAVGSDPSMAMVDFLTQYKAYLAATRKNLFGTTYAVGVLISGKTSVGGGYSEGPPCTTEGASIINYRQGPWSIAPLVAHELAHTLSVVHPFELDYLCQAFPALKFCAAPPGVKTTDWALPANCTCDSPDYPDTQCLMTYMFGRAKVHAPQYTPCDIEMMNHFSSDVACIKKSSKN